MALARASRRVVACCGVLLLTAGCASEFERRYDAADSLRARAAEQGYEWIGTQKLLEQAAVAADEGDTETALELAEQARFQAEAALQQAEREKEAWRRRVVR
jgi:hypothetical protein